MSEQNEQKEDDEFVSRIGILEIDWPRALGYFGGIGLALAFEVVAPPLALFVAAVPFLKLMKRRDANVAERAVGAILEGMSKPIGGDSEGVVRLADDEEEGQEKEGSVAPVAPVVSRAGVGERALN